MSRGFVVLALVIFWMSAWNALAEAAHRLPQFT
jgi:hypothetical protein